MSDKYLGSDQYFLCSQRSWRNLNDRYLLGDGILIERDGSIVWVREWGHRWYRIYLFEDQGCIITDRLASRGPWNFPMGIVCIELSDGSYRWSHVSEDMGKNNRALISDSRPESPKFESYETLHSDGNNLITPHFIIDFATGDFTHRDESHSPEHLRSVPPTPKMEYPQEVFEDCDLDFLQEHPFYGEGEPFSPLQIVWDTGTELLVSAHPERSNDTRILTVDTSTKEIVRSWVLPIDGAVRYVSPFFDQGLLVVQWARHRYYLTLFHTEERV